MEILVDIEQSFYWEPVYTPIKINLDSNFSEPYYKNRNKKY